MSSRYLSSVIEQNLGCRELRLQLVDEVALVFLLLLDDLKSLGVAGGGKNIIEPILESLRVVKRPVRILLVAEDLRLSNVPPVQSSTGYVADTTFSRMAFETPISSGISLSISVQRWLWLTFWRRR